MLSLRNSKNGFEIHWDDSPEHHYLTNLYNTTSAPMDRVLYDLSIQEQMDLMKQYPVLVKQVRDGLVQLLVLAGFIVLLAVVGNLLF